MDGTTLAFTCSKGGTGSFEKKVGAAELCWKTVLEDCQFTGPNGGTFNYGGNYEMCYEASGPDASGYSQPPPQPARGTDRRRLESVAWFSSTARDAHPGSGPRHPAPPGACGVTGTLVSPSCTRIFWTGGKKAR